MIKLVETVKFTDPEKKPKTQEKTFRSRKSLEEALKRSRYPGVMKYDLMKKGSHTIHYDDATVEIKIVDETPKFHLVDRFGKPIETKDADELGSGDRESDQG